MAPPRVGGSPTPVRKLPAAPPPIATKETTTPPPPALHSKDEFTPVATSAARKPRKYDTEALAAKPADALTAWKHLGKSQRAKVLEGMEKRYGKAFTEEFHAAAKNPKLRNFDAWANGPGVGPSEKTLRDLGYKPYAPELPHRRGIMNEVWVHPSGKEVYQVYETKPSKAEAAKASEIQEHWKGIVDDSKEGVIDMKTWLDDLKSRKASDPDYPEAFTEFWLQLKQEHDNVKSLLDNNPDMPAATRTELKAQLKELEGINKSRADLPQHIEVPPGHDATVMPDWLYLNKSE
jgi:hypothetical protein